MLNLYSNLTKNSCFPLWLLAVGIFAWLVGPQFLTEGMFFDGVTYAAIANNMAHGIGTFWHPHYTQTLFADFHQHPPLAMGILSVFYRVFGDSVYVEKFYSMLTILLTAWALVLIWAAAGKPRRTAWLPLLLWFIHPTVFWAATNNILENTMGVFVAFAAWLALRAEHGRRAMRLLAAGMLLAAAFLCKGFTGMFPLALPFFVWLWLYPKNVKTFASMALNTCLILAGMAAVLGVIFAVSDQAFPSIRQYFYEQVVGSIQNVVTVPHRWIIMKKWTQENLPYMAIVIAAILLQRRSIAASWRMNWRWMGLFFCCGMSGVLPIMISMKQGSFYMMTALPFFAAAWAFAAGGGRNVAKIFQTNKHAKINYYYGSRLRFLREAWRGTSIMRERSAEAGSGFWQCVKFGAMYPTTA